MNTLFIFRRDFRIRDNTGLNSLLENNDTIFPIFIFTPEQITNNTYKSDNCVQFMVKSLFNLEKYIEITMCYGMIESIIEDIVYKNNITKTISNNYIINRCLSYIKSNNLIINYILTQYIYIYNKYYLFINFNDIIQIDYSLNNFTPENKIYIVAANKILYNLKIYIKKIMKNKIYKYCNKMFNVHYELKHYIPNNNINILKNGSFEYQYNKHKFNKNISNKIISNSDIIKYKNFIIKSYNKYMVTRYISITAVPCTKYIINYQIKTEYNENLDLYLIYDIDIPNTTFFERYNYLRKLHPYVNSFDIKIITSMSDYFNIINNEINIINNFSLKYINYIKWYPKISVIFNFTNNLQDNFQI